MADIFVQSYLNFFVKKALIIVILTESGSTRQSNLDMKMHISQIKMRTMKVNGT